MNRPKLLNAMNYQGALLKMAFDTYRERREKPIFCAGVDTDMDCPNCGAESGDQGFCGTCGQKLAEFSPLLADKATRPDKPKIQKRKAQRLRLRLWTAAGIVFYIVLYWIIISEIIIRKGHKQAGILFLVVITVISVGGLLILYSAALGKRSAYRVSDPRGEKPDTLGTQTLELKTGAEPTPELPEKEVTNGK